MKNIGLIVNSLQGGGAERCAADLSIYFEQKGYKVYILTDVSTVKYKYSGVLVDFTTTYTAYSKASINNPLVEKINELKGLKRKYHIDIAISFMQQENYVNILSKESEKVILTTHSITSEYLKFASGSGLQWSENTFRELYQYADVITCPSEHCRKDWIEHYGDENNIVRTMYNPVHFMNATENPCKQNIVITIGRMHAIKRQKHIIKAFKQVKEKCPDSRLIILGDGELRTKLEAMVTKLGLEECVDMPGNVTNVQDYLAVSKVFVTTSRCDAMPCAVLEAMSASVPVVACDIPGGIREELEIACSSEDDIYPIYGNCGIVTPYIKEVEGEEITYEEQCMADEIVYLLKNEAIRQCMGHNARERAKEFEADKIGDAWIYDIFKNSLNREIDREEFESIRKKHFKMFEQKKRTSMDMYQSYYKLLEVWMTLREQKKNVQSALESMNYKNVIIYGLGKMAKHLLYDLKNSNIKITCVIDKAAINKYGDFPIITCEEMIPTADCIIVTPVYEFDSIKNMLVKKTDIPVISLTELINNCK